MTYRILVALDGTAASEAVLSDVERIAVGGAGVHFLNVVPMLPVSVDATSAGVMAGHDRALGYLRAVRERLPNLCGLDLIRAGDLAEAILQAALEFNIDLIAMGIQDRTGLAKGPLGTTAETVLRQAKRPVLLKRPGPSSTQTKLRRILVPVDESPESLSILSVAKDLAIRTGAEVVILHVSVCVQALVAPHGEARASVDPKEKLLRLAAAFEKTDVVFWQTIGEGDAVEEILTHARTLDADLIALATPAGGRIENAVVGNSALTLLERTDRAVLLQRCVAPLSVATPWKYQ